MRTILSRTTARPPANLDRVFEYKNELYQVDDRQLFEQEGIDLSTLTKSDKGQILGFESPLFTRDGQNQIIAGADFATELNEVGAEVEMVINNEGFSNNAARDSAFQSFVSSSAITPLTDGETRYYNDKFESLGDQEKQSPYQSTDDAMKSLGNELAFWL